jgi:hypothetical protein
VTNLNALNEIDLFVTSGFQPTTAPTPILTPTPIRTNPNGQPIVTSTTIVPNGTGFWSPWQKAFVSMGADPGTVNLLMTAFLVIILGIVVGVASNFEPKGFNSGAALGFILACSFGWIFFWFIVAGVAWILAPFFLWRTPG